MLALTDHDTVDGVTEALTRPRVRHRIIPAVELSSVHGEHEDLHILGYGLDHTDRALLATLEDFREDRIRRILAMADKLRELGFTSTTPRSARVARAPAPRGRAARRTTPSA